MNRRMAKRCRTEIGFQRHISADPSQNPLKIRQYSLRAFARLIENLLFENCFAPLSEQFSRDFWCGGRSLADARQGQQAKKHRKGPLKGGSGSASLRPKAHMSFRNDLMCAFFAFSGQIQNLISKTSINQSGDGSLIDHSISAPSMVQSTVPE